MECIKELEVGTRLKNLRLSVGAKMIDAAIEFDISMAQYSRLESGKAAISVDVLIKACQYYQCDVDYLLFGKKKMQKSFFFEKLRQFPEKDIRRFLKILACLMDMEDSFLGSQSEAMYKLFAGGLLERIPCTADNAIPYVLEYEKSIQGKSENAMIRELNLTRFKWNSIMHGTRVSDLGIPLCISRQYGYDLDFLIENKIPETTFFDEFYEKLEERKQKKVMKQFEDIIFLEGEALVIEKQVRR